MTIIPPTAPSELVWTRRWRICPACREVDRLADEWETRTSGLVLRLELERRGKAGRE